MPFYGKAGHALSIHSIADMPVEPSAIAMIIGLVNQQSGWERRGRMRSVTGPLYGEPVWFLRRASNRSSALAKFWRSA